MYQKRIFGEAQINLTIDCSTQWGLASYRTLTRLASKLSLYRKGMFNVYERMTQDRNRMICTLLNFALVDVVVLGVVSNHLAMRLIYLTTSLNNTLWDD